MTASALLAPPCTSSRADTAPSAVTDFIQGHQCLAGIAAVVVYIVLGRLGGVGSGVEALAAEGVGSLLPCLRARGRGC